MDKNKFFFPSYSFSRKVKKKIICTGEGDVNDKLYENFSIAIIEEKNCDYLMQRKLNWCNLL